VRGRREEKDFVCHLSATGGGCTYLCVHILCVEDDDDDDDDADATGRGGKEKEKKRKKKEKKPRR